MMKIEAGVNFGELINLMKRKSVSIEKHGKITAVFLSVAEHEKIQSDSFLNKLSRTNSSLPNRVFTHYIGKLLTIIAPAKLLASLSLNQSKSPIFGLPPSGSFSITIWSSMPVNTIIWPGPYQ